MGFCTERVRAQVVTDTLIREIQSPQSDSLLRLTDSLKPLEIKGVQSNLIKGKKTIQGVVLDFTTNEPISFATVFFPGTSVGKKDDIDGIFL
ncbi:MAG TPA: hypothetical protein DCF44_03365 [Chitinophagaceae bacterium]|nr:hypothetical protein [Chitinophagaceae bacterium]